MFQKNVPLLIKVFAGLHYLSAVLVLVPMALLFTPFISLGTSLPQLPISFLVVITLFGILIQVLIARALVRGKKWVQHLYIFIGVMGTMMGLLGVILLKFHSPERILSLVLCALIAYYFIFSKEAKSFFNPNHIPLPPEQKSESSHGSSSATPPSAEISNM